MDEHVDTVTLGEQELAEIMDLLRAMVAALERSATAQEQQVEALTNLNETLMLLRLLAADLA